MVADGSFSVSLSHSQLDDCSSTCLLSFMHVPYRQRQVRITATLSSLLGKGWKVFYNTSLDIESSLFDLSQLLFVHTLEC